MAGATEVVEALARPVEGQSRVVVDSRVTDNPGCIGAPTGPDDIQADSQHMRRA